MTQNNATIRRDAGEASLDSSGLGYSAEGEASLELRTEFGIDILRVAERGRNPQGIFFTGMEVTANLYLVQWDSTVLNALFPGMASGTNVNFDFSKIRPGMRLDPDYCYGFSWAGSEWTITGLLVFPYFAPNKASRFGVDLTQQFPLELIFLETDAGMGSWVQN